MQFPSQGENVAAVHKRHSTSQDPIVWECERVLSLMCVWVAFFNLQFCQGRDLIGLLFVIFNW